LKTTSLHPLAAPARDHSQTGFSWIAQSQWPQAVNDNDIKPYLNFNAHDIVCPSGGTTFVDSCTITIAAVRPVCQKDLVRHLLPP